MQAKNRIKHYFLALLILIPLLAACRGEESEEPPSQQVTITFACPEYQESTYRNLADQFEADNPDIRVQLVLLGHKSDLNEIVTQADTLLMPAFSPSLAEAGLVRDLTPFIEADGPFRSEDFHHGILESLQWDGGTWGLPSNLFFHLIFYDKEVFDAASVPYPEPGWTWDDFLAKAQVLTEWEGDDVTRWGFAWHLRDPLPFTWGRVGSLVETSGETPVPLLDQPEVMEKVRWFTNLALKHQVMPLDDGSAAMWTETTMNWSGENSKVGLVPVPIDTSDSATTPIQLRPYVMSAGTSHPRESWRWLAFLSRQSTTDGIPARRSTASSYWDSLDEEVATTYRFALEHGFSLVETTWVEPALSSAVEAVLQGEQTVEEALAQAQTAALTYIESELGAATAGGSFEVPTPVPSDSGEAEVITFLATRTYHRKKDIYEALAERFHEVHPELVVEIRQPEFPAETSEVTLEQMAAQGDCLEVFAALGTDRSALMSLDPFIEAEATFSLDDFYPSFLEPFRRQGRLWALPTEGYPRVMYYNKELFDAADLTYPSLDWTLDDFLTLAEALTQDKDKQYGYILHPGPFIEPLFFVEQQGARLMDDSAGQVAYTLDTPTMAKAVRWYVDLIRRYGVTLNLGNPDDYVQHYELWRSLIQDGKAAMWSMYPLEASNIWREIDWGAVPMPQGLGQVNDFVLIGYSISARSEHPQACWEWLKFLLEQPELIQGVPARRSIAESDEYRQGVDANLADAYFSIKEQDDWTLISAKQLRTKRNSFILGQFRQVLKAAVDGENVEQALSEAQRKVDEYILCLETTTGYEDEEELVSACTAQTEVSEP
jgi:ABC-type glycerol-3-phosphate transport system substrate-binding protein